MKTRERFLYMILGGMFGATLICVGMAVSPLTAQRDSFGEITCSGLRVLYPDGTVAVYLGRNDDGGEVSCYDTAGNGQVSMQSSKKHGGSLRLFLTGDDYNLTPVSITADGREGYISILGETGTMGLDSKGFTMIDGALSAYLSLKLNSDGDPIFTIADVGNKDKVQKSQIAVTARGGLFLWQNDELEGFGLLNSLTSP